MKNHNHNDETETIVYNDPGTFLAGLLLGGLAGATAMLLFAPQSGKRTRSQIQLKGLQLRHQATEAVDDALAQTRIAAHQIKAEVRSKARELKHTGEELLAEQEERLSAAVSAGKSALHV